MANQFGNGRKGLGEILKEFAINYILTFLAGAAGVLIFSILIPVIDIVFALYKPLDFFLDTYIYACVAVFIATVIFWIVCWKYFFCRTVLPYILSLMLIVIAGLMRSETIIPNVVGVQFVFFFASILLLCEALIIHAGIIMLRFMRASGLIRG